MQLKHIILKHKTQGYSKANILIDDGIITKVDYFETNPTDYREADFYVTPGFVNSHLHPNQLLDRRLLDELNITELLHLMHSDYKKTDEDRYIQALLVLMEAVRSGSTSIYAVASHPYPVIKAFNTLRIKGAVSCFYHDQWEGYGSPPALSRLKFVENHFSHMQMEKTSKIGVHIGSTSLESASNDLLLLMDHLAQKFSTKVNIHISEGIESVNSCVKSRKMTPVRLLKQLEVLSKKWNLIHAVNVDEEEIECMADAKAGVIHCPISNAKTGVGIAPVPKFMKHKIPLALGSDACSNNNTNNILNEAYFASLFHAALHKDPQAFSTETMMEWITTNGHRIIGTKQKGMIQEGEPADLLLWSLKESPFVPLVHGKFDSAIINNAPDIKPHTVFIDGKAVVERYQFKEVSEREVRENANFCGYKLFTSMYKLIS